MSGTVLILTQTTPNSFLSPTLPNDGCYPPGLPMRKLRLQEILSHHILPTAQWDSNLGLSLSYAFLSDATYAASYYTINI